MILAERFIERVEVIDLAMSSVRPGDASGSREPYKELDGDAS